MCPRITRSKRLTRGDYGGGEHKNLQARACERKFVPNKKGVEQHTAWVGWERVAQKFTSQKTGRV